MSFLGVMGFLIIPTGASAAFDLSGIASTITGGASSGFMGVLISLFGFAASGFCWFCDLYKTLFNIMNTLATTVSKSLAGDFLMLLGIGVLFFIGFKVGSVVVKLQEVDLMQFLGELFKQLGRAIIAAAFLLGSVEMYHYLISPFLAYALALTHEIMSSRDAGTITELVTKLLGGGKDGSKFIPDINAGILGEGSGMAFSNQIRDQLIGILELVSASLISGLIIGAAMLLIGLADSYLNIIPNFQIMTVGVIIIGAYFSVYVAVPFKLIDVMVRLTFVAALTPLWVILWVFPATISYTKNAWEMLLNCCACIICLGVVLVIALEIMEYMLPGKETIIFFLLGGLDMLATGQMNLINPHVLQTGALGLLVVNLIKQSSVIATQIVKSYGTSVGDGMDAYVQKGMTSMGNLGAVLGGAAAAATAGGLKKTLEMGRDLTQGGRSNNWSQYKIDEKLGTNAFNSVNNESKKLDSYNEKLARDGKLTEGEEKDRKEIIEERGRLIQTRKPRVEAEMQDLDKQKAAGKINNEEYNEKYGKLKAERDVLNFYERNPNAGAKGVENLQARLAEQYQQNPKMDINQALGKITPQSANSDLSSALRNFKTTFGVVDNNPQPQTPPIRK